MAAVAFATGAPAPSRVFIQAALTISRYDRVNYSIAITSLAHPRASASLTIARIGAFSTCRGATVPTALAATWTTAGHALTAPVLRIFASAMQWL